MNKVPEGLWAVPEAGGLRYIYVPGLSLASSPAVLAYEPELDPARRLVLQTDGEIKALSSESLAALRKGEGRP